MKIKLLRIFTKINHFFKDHKVFFEKVFIAVLLSSLIIAALSSLIIPASAAGDPAESDQVIIPAGVYRFNDTISRYSNDDFELEIPISLNTPSFSIGDTSFGAWNGIKLFGDSNYFSMSYLGDELPVLTVYSSVTNTNNPWDSASLLLEGLVSTGYGQTINVTESASVPSSFGSWFFANVTGGGSVDPDPDPQQYLISAGEYRAKSSWTTALWPIADDSIKFRYFNPFSDSYVIGEGIVFYFDNDIVTIQYGNDSVYTDGWNSDAFRAIEITEDYYTNDDQFYTVFNNIFAPSIDNDYYVGYSVGFDAGKQEGYEIGYNQGFAEGTAEGSGNFFADIIGGVVQSLDRFVLFGGYSLLDLFTTLLGGLALVWILKLLAGG